MKNKEDRVFVSKHLIDAIREHKKPLYMIAIDNKISPSALSRFVNRIETVRVNDKRILRLAKYMNLNADECFEKIA